MPTLVPVQQTTGEEDPPLAAVFALLLRAAVEVRSTGARGASQKKKERQTQRGNRRGGHPRTRDPVEQWRKNRNHRGLPRGPCPCPSTVSEKEKSQNPYIFCKKLQFVLTESLFVRRNQQKQSSLSPWTTPRAILPKNAGSGSKTARHMQFKPKSGQKSTRKLQSSNYGPPACPPSFPWTLTRGFRPASCPTAPLVSFHAYRQLHGWVPSSHRVSAPKRRTEKSALDRQVLRNAGSRPRSCQLSSPASPRAARSPRS